MDKEEVIILIPLVNFDCSENLITFDNSLCIRRTSAEEISGIVDRAVGHRTFFMPALVDLKFLIQKKMDNSFFNLWKEDSPNIQKIALSLRLFASWKY